jgi:hypothetical protein
MMHRRRVVFVLVVVCAVATSSAALAGSARTVCARGCEFASLQAAVDSSEWGATIELGPGVYAESVVLRGALTIRGAGAERTVIEGGSRGAVLRLEGPLTYSVRLEDLTIRGVHRGWISSGAGQVWLERCVVREAGSAAGRDDVGWNAPNVSSTSAPSADAISGGPVGGGPSDLAPTVGSSGGGVTLCHIPPGNPGNAQTIEVGQAAVPAHLAHGDLSGECPYECDGAPSPVAQTGQTLCWHDSGVPIDCAGTGQDGEYQCGVSVELRFTYNDDGTVTDNLTGLIWLQDANCFGVRFWTDAPSTANGLADGICGLTDGSVAGDWRLPNVRELHSLVAYGDWIPALPADHPFSRVQSRHYWSSTPYTDHADFAWSVYVGDGHVSYYGKNNGFYVWPVRGGQ